MFLFLAILSCLIIESAGYYYYPPSPFGIQTASAAAVWPPQQQRTYVPRFQYNSIPSAFGGRESSSSFSSGNIAAAHQRAEYCADLRLIREANYLIQKADLNQTDIDSILERAKAWDIDGIKDEIYEIVNNKFDTNDRNRTLELLDILGPPMSFTDALEVLTIEQKTHIVELFQTNRYQDLSIVINGFTKSLPDADQRQARRFVQAVHYLLQNKLPRNY